MPLCLSTSNHHSRLHLFPPLFPCSSSPSLWSCALLFGDARRKHHHHREPSHLIPPEPCFITGGAAHVITDPLPAVTSVTYRICEMESMSRGRERRSRRSRTFPTTTGLRSVPPWSLGHRSWSILSESQQCYVVNFSYRLVMWSTW